MSGSRDSRANRPKRSPAMEQFFRAKGEHPDALLFFRMGDFYEMFFEDAVLASQLLDLTLTSRGTDGDGVNIPMAGVPHHAASGYIARLLEQGQRVAICEQMEDPSKVKGIVPREVVRVVTPALVLDPDALDARASNYLAALFSTPGKHGLAALELGAAEARAATLEGEADVLTELVRLDAREILTHGVSDALADSLRRALPKAVLRKFEAAQLAAAQAEPSVTQAIQAAAAASSVQIGEAARAALAMALDYTRRAQPGTPLDLERIVPYDTHSTLLLDEAAVRNLELVSTLAGERRGSLLHFLDVTKTSMGARALRRRLLAPLTEVEPIRRRHDSVEAFV
ncbi:MAG TPA: DNA mismatch repair protein MutS, partial [Polyangiales bacterium]|nr:DNA mismatch repair protein MutS [Polyangiales bacterium]